MHMRAYTSYITHMLHSPPLATHCDAHSWWTHTPSHLTAAASVQTDDTKANFWQVVPKGPDVAANPHPDREAVAETMSSTMDALSRVVDSKLTAANPKALNATTKPGGPTYVKYTPQQASKQHNSGVEHRIIQMQEMPTDPLEPPKFRHQKVPKVPDSTPVPVLHSPPRPVTREDQVNWKIPPCVSAWKNNKVRRPRSACGAVARC